MTVDAMPSAVLVELVNGWGSVPREARAVDYPGEGYPPIAGIALPAGPELTDRALTLAADRLHPVFATVGAAGQARLVNELLVETGVRPLLSVMGDHTHANWAVGDGADAVLAAAAVALRRHLADHGSQRLGVCTGRRCADVYIDASPAGRRRFCSVTCQNRARVATFRSRRASAQP
ncbi:CGNR zinc finger domain-containing protein [Nonomuraea insulae]|uniref:CGNR zinc finger domain-containing protein n=1 Tax=Nonomuraea insulae TaxID=1616787 RepID=A0ABW1CJT6_9ACTN